jgi:hypothetical protein
VAATLRTVNALDDLKARSGDRLWVASLDVTDTAAVRRVVDRAFTDLGRIDVVVNNAGYGLFGAGEEASECGRSGGDAEQHRREQHEPEARGCHQHPEAEQQDREPQDGAAFRQPLLTMQVGPGRNPKQRGQQCEQKGCCPERYAVRDTNQHRGQTEQPDDARGSPARQFDAPHPIVPLARQAHVLAQPQHAPQASIPVRTSAHQATCSTEACRDARSTKSAFARPARPCFA